SSINFVKCTVTQNNSIHMSRHRITRVSVGGDNSITYNTINNAVIDDIVINLHSSSNSNNISKGSYLTIFKIQLSNIYIVRIGIKYIVSTIIFTSDFHIYKVNMIDIAIGRNIPIPSGIQFSLLRSKAIGSSDGN